MILSSSFHVTFSFSFLNNSYQVPCDIRRLSVLSLTLFTLTNFLLSIIYFCVFILYHLRHVPLAIPRPYAGTKWNTIPLVAFLVKRAPLLPNLIQGLLCLTIGYLCILPQIAILSYTEPEMLTLVLLDIGLVR